MADYLVRVLTRNLQQLPLQERGDLVEREQRRGRELVAEGTIQQLWRVPGALYNVGIWSAPDAAALHEAFTSLPIFPYVEFEVTPLAPHPVMTTEARSATVPESD